MGEGWRERRGGRGREKGWSERINVDLLFNLCCSCESLCVNCVINLLTGVRTCRDLLCIYEYMFVCVYECVCVFNKL